MNGLLIKTLNECGVKKTQIETDLGMPKNSLSSMLSGIKEIPAKWVQPLTEYANKLSVGITPITDDTPKTKMVVEKTGLKEKPSDENMKKLRLVMDSINKDYGAGTVMILGDTPAHAVEVISTGSYGIDAALGVGGLPKGRIIEIYGPESSGKTTIALHVIAEAQKLGGTCAFIDAEHAFDPTYAENLNIKVEDLFISQPSSGEQALEIADRLVLSGAISVVVIDSVAALVPKSELEGEMGDSKMGLMARLMSQAMRKMAGSISKTNTIVIFINQLRDMIGNTWGGPTETTTGGKALKFYASVRLDVRRIQQIKDGDIATGNRVRVKVVKNKVAPPFKIAEFDIIFGRGINKIGEIIDASVAKNIIQKSGSWYSYGQTKLGQGRDAIIELLNSNPEMLTEIENKITIK